MLSQDIIHKKFTIPSISFAVTVFWIRIREAPKTYQNHEEKNVLKNTIYTKKNLGVKISSSL